MSANLLDDGALSPEDAAQVALLDRVRASLVADAQSWAEQLGELPMLAARAEKAGPQVRRTLALERASACRPEVAAAFGAEVLPAGAGLCPSELRRKVDRVRLRIEAAQADPADAERQEAARLASRRTFARPTDDGTALAGAVGVAARPGRGAGRDERPRPVLHDPGPESGTRQPRQARAGQRAARPAAPPAQLPPRHGRRARRPAHRGGRQARPCRGHR